MAKFLKQKIMKSRLKEFRDIMCGFTDEEIESYTNSELKDWLAAWDNYIRVEGGHRPPRRPPI